MKSDAQILDKKIELIQWLSSLEDNAIIEKLVQFRKSETKDWWRTISTHEKASILKGIEDANKKKIKPHSSAKKLYKGGYKIFWTEHALSELEETF
jgi:hypothetical protein